MNPYLITTNLKTAVFPWDKLLKHGGDTAEQILGLCTTHTFAYRHFTSRLPDAFQPPGHELHALMTQTLKIERSRAEIEGHGPQDTLTVTLSSAVNRDSSCFDNTTQQFQHAVCAAIDVPPLTWTGVSRIRLVRTLGNPCVLVNTRHFVELVRQGAHGQEIVCAETWALANLTGWTSRHVFAHRLTQDLHLRHVTALHNPVVDVFDV